MYWLFETYLNGPNNGLTGIYALPGGPTTFTADTQLTAGTQVTYKIIAFNRAGASSFSSTTSTVTIR